MRLRICGQLLVLTMWSIAVVAVWCGWWLSYHHPLALTSSRSNAVGTVAQHECFSVSDGRLSVARDIFGRIDRDGPANSGRSWEWNTDLSTAGSQWGMGMRPSVMITVA